MAQFINFPVTNGYTLASTNAAAPAQDGDNLVPAGDIATVVCSLESNNNVPIATITFLNSTKVITVGIAVSATALPSASTPATSTILNMLKSSITKAITANPGGVKSTVSLGQDTADATAKYDPAKQLYIRSFIVT